MRRHRTSRVIMALAIIVIIGGLGLFFVTRGDSARLPDTASLGPSPTLPEPAKSLMPTVHIAFAKGWPEGSIPTAASGLAVEALASGLDHPRWLYVLPNGDVLVAETNAPPKPDDAKGIKGKVMGAVQKKAGAGAPTANRIVLLREAGGMITDMRGGAEMLTQGTVLAANEHLHPQLLKLLKSVKPA